MTETRRTGTILLLLMLLASLPAQAFEFQGFGDLTAGDSEEPGQAPGFTLGQIDLWATHTLDEERRTRAFLEVVIESVDGEVIVDLERLWIEYALTPRLKVRGGRFHSAIGYWNRVYHHGSYVQTTIDRPLFMDFEDGEHAIFPTHLVGMMGLASQRTALGRVDLEVQVGNGTFYNGSEMDPGTGGDIDRDKAVMARLFFRPRAVHGLGLGLNFSRNAFKQVTASGAVAPLVTQRLWVFDLSYMDGGWEVLGEYFLVGNEDPAGTTRNSSAWYVQVGRRLSENLIPYLRHEDLTDVDHTDPYFVTLDTHEYTRSLVGLRYELSETSAVKVELRSIDKGQRYAGYWAQWTFAF